MVSRSRSRCRFIFYVIYRLGMACSSFRELRASPVPVCCYYTPPRVITTEAPLELRAGSSCWIKKFFILALDINRLASYIDGITRRKL